MLKRIIQACFLLFGGTLGIVLIPDLFTLFNFNNSLFNNPYVTTIVGALVFYLLTFWTIDYLINLIKWVEEFLIKTPVTDLVCGSVGLIFGLLVAFIIGFPLNAIHVPIINNVAPILLNLLFGYLGFKVGFKKRKELSSLFTKGEKKAEDDGLESFGLRHSLKILDTSVIIDGRIADICETGFLEGTIVIPQFVLMELQQIADSSDAIKRNRGRRGLDILNHIQKEQYTKVEIYDGDFKEIQEVDSKLVKLAKLLNGVVVTNDFNLNKVCEIQNVSVLNINDLALAVKPVVLPGEEMNVQVIKDGKEQNQGIAYLDDGTMIVIEDGRNFIGKQINVLVTRVLQSSSGKMIFAKPKLEKVLLYAQ